MRKSAVFCLLTSSAILAGCNGSSSDSNNSDNNSSSTQDLTIQFAAEVADQPFSCSTTYAGLGTQDSQASFTDFRVYLHDVRLIDSDGNRHAVTLTNDGIWQTDDVALLDFETGDGSCSGTTETNTVIRGTVAQGSYTGIEFGVGVPGQLNHQDSAAADSPLNISGLFWRWQSGYKHARIDIDLATPYTYTDGEGTEQTTNKWFFHLGSTDCSGDPTAGEEVTCANPNRPTITLNNFSADTNKITLDYARLMSTTDLSASTPMPFGCMSSTSDPDCTGPLANIGVTSETQTFFASETL